MHDGISTMPGTQAIDIFMSVPKFAYMNDLQGNFGADFVIDDSIYSALTTLAVQSFRNYKKIKRKLNKLIKAQSTKQFAQSIKYFSERMTQQYFESQKQEMDIIRAVKVYHQLNPNTIRVFWLHLKKLFQRIIPRPSSV